MFELNKRASEPQILHQAHLAKASWLVRLPHDTDLGDLETDLGDRDRERLGDRERERPNLRGDRDLKRAVELLPPLVRGGVVLILGVTISFSGKKLINMSTFHSLELPALEEEEEGT